MIFKPLEPGRKESQLSLHHDLSLTGKTCLGHEKSTGIRGRENNVLGLGRSDRIGRTEKVRKLRHYGNERGTEVYVYTLLFSLYFHDVLPTTQISISRPTLFF